MIKVCEIFRSIQGESSWSGYSCSFIRLTGCNLRCLYCDTRYSWLDGTLFTVEQIVSTIESLKSQIIEITGGEPLLQPETVELCRLLLTKKYIVLLETNGTLDVAQLPDGVIRIIDVKCPSSGYEGSFYKKNLEYLKSTDECKFVISDRNDFNWALTFVREHQLFNICQVIFSPNLNFCHPKDLAQWILDSNAEVRLGLQLHKYIWGSDIRGV